MTETPWWDAPLIAFDLETTGPNPETAAIVTANVSLVQPDGSNAGRTLVIDPGVPIPDGAAAVHGYTTERVQAEGLDRHLGLDMLFGMLRTVVRETGAPLVAFNAVFDLTVVDREFRRQGRVANLAPVTVIDPFVLDKHVDTYRKGKRTLGSVAAFYGVELADAHDAAADALAAVAVAREIGRRYGFGAHRDDGDHPVDVTPAGVGALHPDARALHEHQREWRAAQQDGLRAYFDRQGIAHDGVPGTWPWHPLVGDVLPLDGSDSGSPA